MVIRGHMTYANGGQFPTASRGAKGYSTDLPPITDSVSGTWLFAGGSLLKSGILFKIFTATSLTINTTTGADSIEVNAGDALKLNSLSVRNYFYDDISILMPRAQLYYDGEYK